MKLNVPNKLLKNIKLLIILLKLQGKFKSITVIYDDLPMNMGGGMKEEEPGHYLIVLNKNHPNGMLKRTLCHEMVHVQQMCLGKLQNVIVLIDGKETRFDLWNGKVTTGKYETLPWEIEAFKMEGKLYKRLPKF